MIEEVEALCGLQTAPSAGRLLISCTAPARLILRLSAGPTKQLINTLIARGLSAGGNGVVEVSIGVSSNENALLLTGSIHHSALVNDAALRDSSLPLASAIAASLGGRLTRTPNLGAGETITFVLPSEVADLDDIAAPEEEDSPLPARTHI